MKVKALSLKNFRLYEAKSFEFSSGANMIFGPNARGKTTILEALCVLFTARSFRTSVLSDLITKGKTFFSLEALFEKEGVEQSLSFSYDGKKRKILHNATSIGPSHQLFGIIRGSCLVPDDVDLIKGGPKVRRRFLDLQLAQSDPLYVYHLARYLRAQKQRNSLLREQKTTQLGPWEEQMAEAASYVIVKRNQALKRLSLLAGNVQSVLSDGSEDLFLHYKCAFDPLSKALQDDIMQQLEVCRPKELIMGKTLVGPHRDDIALKIEGSHAKTFSSEGQQRTCVTALKVAEWQMLNERSDSHPLMLVDDVGISFDEARKKQTFNLMKQFDQVFLTATEPYSISSEQNLISI